MERRPMEPHAHHKAEDLNGDDDARTEKRSDSFRVELRNEVSQNVKSMKRSTMWTSKCRQSLELRPRS